MVLAVLLLFAAGCCRVSVILAPNTPAAAAAAHVVTNRGGQPGSPSTPTGKSPSGDPSSECDTNQFQDAWDPEQQAVTHFIPVQILKTQRTGLIGLLVFSVVVAPPLSLLYYFNSNSYDGCVETYAWVTAIYLSDSPSVEW